MKNIGRYIHDTSMKIFRRTAAYNEGVRSTIEIEKLFSRKVGIR